MAEQRDSWSKIQIIAGVLTPVLIAAFGSLISYQQGKASEAQKTADRVTNLVKSLHSEKSGERLTAILLLQREKQKHPDEVPDELLAGIVPTLVNVALNDRNPEVSKQAQALVTEVTEKAQDKSLAENVKKNVTNLPARVYIHIRNESARTVAKHIQDTLSENAFNVPGIELMDVGPETNEVRFFRRSEEVEANRIQKLLQTVIGRVETKYVPGFEDSPSMRARHFEVWLAPRNLVLPPPVRNETLERD